jgi:hypothetical protein
MNKSSYGGYLAKGAVFDPIDKEVNSYIAALPLFL